MNDNYLGMPILNKQKSKTAVGTRPSPRKTQQIEQSFLIAGERQGLCFDVVRVDSGVLGRVIVTNYRLRFIENGLRENFDELYDINSLPFASIQNVT